MLTRQERPGDEPSSSLREPFPRFLAATSQSASRETVETVRGSTSAHPSTRLKPGESERAVTLVMAPKFIRPENIFLPAYYTSKVLYKSEIEDIIRHSCLYTLRVNNAIQLVCLIWVNGFEDVVLLKRGVAVVESEIS